MLSIVVSADQPELGPEDEHGDFPFLATTTFAISAQIVVVSLE